MLHQANHATQHRTPLRGVLRSEVAAMLTQFGHSPGELDLLRYLEQQKGAQAQPRSVFNVKPEA